MVNRSFLWDGTRKPDFSTMEEQTVEINGAMCHIAHFNTEPFYDVAEYKQYKRAREEFVKKYRRDPISVDDFMILKTMTEAIQ